MKINELSLNYLGLFSFNFITRCCVFVAEVLEKWWWPLEVWCSGGDGCSEGGVRGGR